MARFGRRGGARRVPAVIILYLKLAFATAVVLAPGWLLARTFGVRSVSATLAWSLVTIFGALAVTFALGSTLTLTLLLLVVVMLAAGVVGIQRGWRPAEAVPGRAWALFWGAVVGLLVWVAAPTVQGDGLFHLARARKLLSLDALSLDRVSEFADGSLHPGYAFPLWHGFIALIAKVAGEDPERVVVHLPSILAPLAVVVAFEAGWALFRRTWAAGVTAGAQVAMICFAPGLGGAYVFLSLPATAARQLLVPAALALAFESCAFAIARAGRIDGRGGSGSGRRPSDLCDLPLDPVRRLPRDARSVGEEGPAQRDARARRARRPCRALLALAAPNRERHALGVARRRRASARIRAVPGPARRPLRHVVQPRARGVHPSRCGRDRGAAPHSAGRACGAASVGGVRRRRVARCLRRDAAAVPLPSRSPTSSRSRRRGERQGSFLSRSRSLVGSGCWPGS